MKTEALLKASAIAVSTALVLNALQPSGGQRPIYASEFVLLDEEGRRRAALGVDDDGVAALQLFAPDGGARASVSVHDMQSRIELAAKDGTPVLELTAGLDRSAVVQIGEEDLGSMLLGYDGKGLSSILLRRADSLQVSISNGPDGTELALLPVRNASGAGIRMTVDNEGSQIGLQNEEGHLKAVLREGLHGRGGELNLFDAKGKSTQLP